MISISLFADHTFTKGFDMSVVPINRMTEKEFKELTSIRNSAVSYLRGRVDGVTRFIFVRHGESKSNKEKSMAGRTLNADLSEQGEEQAQKVGKKLAETGILVEGVYSSPMLRATKTAQHISEALSLRWKIHQDERLHERWYGSFEGASEKEYAPIKKKEEEEIPRLPTFEDKFAYKPDPDMESMKEVYERVNSFIDAVSKEYSGKDVVIATHNAVMKALFMADTAKRGFDVEYQAFDLGNCAIVVVEVDTAGNRQVVATDGLKFRIRSRD